MTLMNLVKSFAKDEAGAVTVDWVVLTAGIVGIGLIVMTIISGGLKTAGTSITGNFSAKVSDGNALE